MDANASERLIEQRVRNRIIEVVDIIAMGDDGVRAVGLNDYFNFFFDWTAT